MSSKVYDDLQQYKADTREITPCPPREEDINARDQGYEGGYLGQVTENGTLYDQYVFKNFLIDGTNRFLMIKIPEHVPEGMGPALAYEVNSFPATIAPARLFFRFDMINVPEGRDYRELDNYNPSDLPYHWPLALDTAKCDIHTLVISSIAYFGTHLYRIKRLGVDNALRWDNVYLFYDFKWHVRSRTDFALQHLRYLYAVPADIILSPLSGMFILYIFIITGGHGIH